MSNYVLYQNKSTFLCENQALKDFVENYIDNYDLSSPLYWSIICERKEDIIVIRNQLSIEIQKIKGTCSHLIGISIYSLDTIGQKICSLLANMSETKFKKQISASLFKPYIDITTQENITKIILNLFGYNSNDSLPLAKQILTLLDINFPAQSSLFELILETQQNHNIKKVQHISEISLRQILATYQQTTLEFSEFARFQVLVNDYLNQYFNEHILTDHFKKDFAVLIEILSGPLLWINSPEYILSQENSSTLKQGNFQQYLVNDFKNAVLKIHKTFSQSHKHNIFYDSQTSLKNFELPSHLDIKVYISSNDYDFCSKSHQLIKENKEENFIFLGDLNPHNFQTIHRKGSGCYSISKKDFENWLSSQYSNDNLPKDSLHQEYKVFFDTKFEKFIDTLSYIQNHESMRKISEIYNLKFISINDEFINKLFMNSMIQEKINIGTPHLISTAPKVLSYFNSLTTPQKIISIGRPHHQVAQSFNVKILNHVFYILKQKGFEIEIPASEIMYQIFWKNLISQTKKVDFWINDKKDLELFPNYLNVTQVLNLNSPISSNYTSLLKLSEENIIPNWQNIIGIKEAKISITQFEDYIICPHKFLLKHILKINKKDSSQLIDFKKIGTIMHRICEQFITRLVLLFGNEGFTTEMPQIFNLILSLLSGENKDELLFLSFDKNSWLIEIKKKLLGCKEKYIEGVILAIEESIDLIWNNDNEVFDTKSDFSKLSFINLQEREILKRTFLRFLMTEFENLKNKTTLKIGLYREVPIEFKFFDLKLTGRIDRIDLTEDGLEIIDYKTSNISKSLKEIALLPSFIKNNIKAKLSVQGAMYSYGFAKSNFQYDNSELGDDILLNKIKYYSLYFLKNLDENKNNYLRYHFNPTLEKNSSNYLLIEEEYIVYAKNLLKGQFTPNPIQENQTCLFCEYKSVCSRTYR